MTDTRTDTALAKIVRDFWAFMTHEYQTKVADKTDAVEMRGAARVLDSMGIIDADAFLKDYVTTIDRRIYVPFVVGEASEDWSLWDQLVVCVHEHQHVEQLDRDGLIMFAGKYVLSHAGRAAYEAEAYRCNLELCFWRTGKLLDTKALAAKLEHYACTKADIAVAAKALALSSKTVARGGIVNRASQKAIAWLDVHGSVFKEHA